MNIEIANRLVQMRKDRGLSQEALAEELGISRQAVSKWERAESSPDTSNLITLAKLYNVSLDELLDTDQERFESGDPLNESENPESTVENEEEKKNNDDFVRVGFNGIYVKDGTDEVSVGWNGIHITEDGKEVVSMGKRGVRVDGEDYSHDWKGNGLISLLVVAAYFILGAVYSLWHPGWLIFFLIPILSSFFNAIKRRNLGHFSFAVLIFASIMTAIIAFGMPWTAWFALILIPIFDEIVKLFGGKREKRVHFGATIGKDGNLVRDTDVDVSFGFGDDEEN